MPDRKELARRLRNRYEEQCERSPTFRNDIPWSLYKRRNLSVVVQNDAYLLLHYGREALEGYKGN